MPPQALISWVGRPGRRANRAVCSPGPGSRPDSRPSSRVTALLTAGGGLRRRLTGDWRGSGSRGRRTLPLADRVRAAPRPFFASPTFFFFIFPVPRVSERAFSYANTHILAGHINSLINRPRPTGLPHPHPPALEHFIGRAAHPHRPGMRMTASCPVIGCAAYHPTELGEGDRLPGGGMGGVSPLRTDRCPG